MNPSRYRAAERIRRAADRKSNKFRSSSVPQTGGIKFFDADFCPQFGGVGAGENFRIGDAGGVGRLARPDPPDDLVDARHKVESRGIYDRGRAADAKQGVASFLENRPARFTLKPSADMPDYFPWAGPRSFVAK